MYRGLLRNTHARILRRVTTDDGSSGSVSTFEPWIERYSCRIWRLPVERVRTDTGNHETTPWGLFGDNLAIHEGDKVIDRIGREFIVTRWTNDDGRGDRVKAQGEGRMRLVAP